MYKGIYAEKKDFSKFDNEHYLCYLNEQREDLLNRMPVRVR